MAAELDGAARGRPSPETLRVTVPSAVIAGFAGKEAVPAAASPAAARGDRAGAPGTEAAYSVSLSVPASPSGLHLAQLGACASVRSDGGDAVRVAPSPAEATPGPDAGHHTAEAAAPQLLKQARFHSQPTLTIRTEEPPLQRMRSVSRSDSTRDRRFDQFKTFSGRLERQLSNLRGVPLPQDPAEVEPADSKISEEETDDDEVPTADRYFAALEGPELETLRPTEVSALPEDEAWPFLLRFPISAFGMCLGVSSQAMLWNVGAGGARRALERCRRDREREHESNTRTRVGLGHQFLLQLSQLFPRLGSSFIHGSPPPRTPTPTDSTMQGDSRWACAVRGHGGERELGGHGADWAQLQSPGFYAITTVKRDYNV